MSSVPLSRDRHGAYRWKRFDGYGFAATTTLVPLATNEVTRAALSLPLAFAENGEGWTMAAVLGFVPGENLLVGANGSWIAPYTPAALRAYPFRNGWNERVEPVLCVDEASGLIVEGAEGEAFFDADGRLSTAVQQVWDFLQVLAKGEVALVRASNLLHEAGLVVPWPISFDTDAGKQHVKGLYRIDEAAMNALDDARFGELRRAGVIGLAYAQLLSMANLTDLGQLALARAQAEAAKRAQAEVKPLITLPDDSTIDWDWSKVGR